MSISNLLDLTHPTQSSHFTAENWQRVVVELIYGPLPSCSRASMMPQQTVPPGTCPVPIHVQPERNYGEIPSLSFTWADVSMASSTVVFRRSCWISCQLPIATANLEILTLAFSHCPFHSLWQIELLASILHLSLVVFYIHIHAGTHGGQIILFHTMIFQLGYLTWFGQGILVSRTQVEAWNIPSWASAIPMWRSIYPLPFQFRS